VSLGARPPRFAPPETATRTYNGVFFNARSSEPEAQAPGVLWVGIHVTEAFAVGCFVRTERHGSLALAARMGTNFPGSGLRNDSGIAGFRSISQDYLAKCTVNQGEFRLEE